MADTLPGKPADVPRCDKCGGALAKRRTGKIVLIMKHRHFALADNGDGEMICPECHQATGIKRQWFIVGPKLS